MVYLWNVRVSLQFLLTSLLNAWGVYQSPHTCAMICPVPHDLCGQVPQHSGIKLQIREVLAKLIFQAKKRSWVHSGE